MSRPILDANTFQAAYGHERGEAGLLAPQIGCVGQVELGIAAKRAYAVRFVPSREMTITKIAYVVTAAATSNDKVDVGIYNSTLTTKLVSSGETESQLNATGVRTVSVSSTVLVPGTTYYAAIGCGTVGGTAAKLAAVSFIAAGFANIFSSTVGSAIVAFQDTAIPLSASITTGGALTSVPILAVRES